MTTLNDLQKNPDSIHFQDIATSFRTMNGDNVESSFLDTTLSPVRISNCFLSIAIFSSSYPCSS